MSATRCRCGCGSNVPGDNRGGFASQECYALWVVRQRPVLDDAQITALRLAGKSLYAIGKEVGAGEAMVRRRLLVLGVKPPPRPVSAKLDRRRHQKKGGPPVVKRSTVPWARVGTYQHPKLGPWLPLSHPSWCAECRAAKGLVAA